MNDESGEPNLYTYLTGVPAVATLFAERIYHQRAPTGVRGLYAVYQRVGGVRQVTFCDTDSLVEGEYQVDIYSHDDTLMGNGVRAIRTALVDHSGTMGSVRVNKVFLLTDFDSVDPDPGLYRRTQTYQVWYVEG